MSRHVTAAVLLVVVLQACSGPNRATVDADSNDAVWTATSIIDRIVLPEPPGAITATADLSIQSPLYTGNVTVHIRHRAGDSMLVAFAVRGLGIEAARLLITPDSFFLYNRIEREITAGASTNALLPAIFSPADAMIRLLGLIKPDKQNAWKLTETSDGIVLRDAENHEQWIIDPSIGRVLSYERAVPSGQLAEGLYFAEFGPVGNALYPKRVTYRSPLRATNGLLQFRLLDFTDDVSGMALRAPEGIKHTILE